MTPLFLPMLHLLANRSFGHPPVGPKRAFVVICASLGILIAGCSAPMTPREAAHERMYSAIATSDSAAMVDEVATDVRWNPAGCTAPGWQAWLWNRWQRVEIKAVSEEQRDSVETVEMELRKSRDTFEDDNGWVYPVYERKATSP